MGPASQLWVEMMFGKEVGAHVWRANQTISDPCESTQDFSLHELGF